MGKSNASHSSWYNSEVSHNEVWFLVVIVRVSISTLFDLSASTIKKPANLTLKQQSFIHNKHIPCYQEIVL